MTHSFHPPGAVGSGRAPARSRGRRTATPSTNPDPGRHAFLRPTLRFARWVGLLGIAHLVLRASGDLLPPPSGLSDVLLWLERSDPVRTAFSMLRLAGLGIAWYLTGLTVLLVLARLSGAPGLARAVDRVALPVVRRALHGAVGTGLAIAFVGATVPPLVGAAGGAGVAHAEPAPPVVLMEEVSTTSTPGVTMEVIADGGPRAPEPTTTTPGVVMVLVDESPVAPADAGVAASPAPPTTAPAHESHAPEPSGTPSTTTPALPDQGTATTPPTMSETDAAPAVDGVVGGAEIGAPLTPGPPTVRPDGLPVAGVAPPASPAPAASPVATIPDAAAPPEWTVQAGDHLWHIAAVTLEQAHGRPVTDDEVAGYWRELIDANHDRLLTADNPDLIIPGQTFVLPTVPAAPAG